MSINFGPKTVNSNTRAKGLFPVGHDQKVAGQLPALSKAKSASHCSRPREISFKFHHRHGSSKEVTLSLLAPHSCQQISSAAVFNTFSDNRQAQ